MKTRPSLSGQIPFCLGEGCFLDVDATAGVPEIQTSGILAEPARRCCLPWKQQSSRRRARLSRVLEMRGWEE